MGNEFGRRLRDLVEGIRSGAAHQPAGKAADPASARARRRHLEKVALAEAARLVREAEPVFAGLGLKPAYAAEEIRIGPIPGARLPEKIPPSLTVSCLSPAFEDVRVAVVLVTWRVDDPRTPLPEDPCTMRMVFSDDGAGEVADLGDFLTVAIEDFAAAVARFEILPGA